MTAVLMQHRFVFVSIQYYSKCPLNNIANKQEMS